MTVLVDEIDEENGVAVARSMADAPEIDGNVFIEGEGATALKWASSCRCALPMRMSMICMRSVWRNDEDVIRLMGQQKATLPALVVLAMLKSGIAGIGLGVAGSFWSEEG
jgi:hypothetical protein